ncbi:hypothetical protein EDD15DRAFT_2216633 [Pisolithus albus]|nr:hypothetical protein EDD15DRAFT_2216633 [Pisolithus albus]
MCAQSTSTRQPQTQIPRIRVGALDAVTNTRIDESLPKRSPPPPHHAASAHTPIQTHPDVPSPSPPSEQPPQGSPKNVENDEKEELEVADIMTTIADADSDSNVPASKCADNTKADSNSLPTHPRQGASQDGEVDGQMYGDAVMDDSDAEIYQGWTYAHTPGWKD